MAQKRKKNRLPLILGIIALLAFAGMAFAKQQGWVGQKILTKIATEKIERRQIIETVSANGKIYPEAEVSLTSDVSGEVMHLSVQEGDSIKKGQLLAKIDRATYLSLVERAEAAVNSAKANKANSEARILQAKSRIDQLRITMANVRKTYDRQKQLFDQKVIAQADLDNVETQMRTLDADLISLQAEQKAMEKTVEGASYSVQSAEAGLKEANDNLRRTNIYAPINGVLSSLSIEKGERIVGTSQFAGTEIMRISNFKQMEARVDVTENDILRLESGDTAIVEVDAYLDRTFLGVVTHIANSAKQQNALSTDQITNFTVKIRLLEDSYKDLYSKSQFPFRPGMSASADIQTRKANGIVAAPIQSVTTREIPDSLKTKNTKEEDLNELVFVYKDGKVESRKVNVGIQDETYIEITKGLKAGEEVVTAPYRTISRTLEDKMEVEQVDKDDLFKKEN
ncbi:MAG: efflux RND transporter periplasmic adaptor subunit [Chitinophagales bacterium]